MTALYPGLTTKLLHFQAPLILKENSGTETGRRLLFQWGGLIIGCAEGKAEISPVDIVEGASGTGNPVVVNISRFLQSLDEDGDLNNGIQITSRAAGR